MTPVQFEVNNKNNNQPRWWLNSVSAKSGETQCGHRLGYGRFKTTAIPNPRASARLINNERMESNHLQDREVPRHAKRR